MSDRPDDGHGGTARGCAVRAPDRGVVVAGHGGGGLLTRDLVESVFLPLLGNRVLAEGGDCAILPRDWLDAGAPPSGARIAMATDSHVVQPLEFPGGSIGDLAVNGTVNDLAMGGARPIALSAAFVLEEGLSLDLLARVVRDMARAAAAAGVRVVAADTKTVERGRGDGLVIATTGVGIVPAGCTLGATPPAPGDAVIVSGTVGDHGMAVMSVRGGLAFESPIRSDTRPLTGAVGCLLAACPGTRVLRDPTRGGLAMALGEIAAAAGVSIEFEAAAVPVAPAVAVACETLGLDPLEVACEGRFVAVVPESAAEEAVAVLRSHADGAGAVRIGTVTAGPAGRVVARTPFGGKRVVPMPLGEQLPRIC